MFLKVLCDENVPHIIAASLQKRGLDVARVQLGMSDEMIGRQAQHEERVIVTFDSDFANILAFPPQEFFGIVRISISPPLARTIENALRYIFTVLKTPEDFKGRLFILEPNGFRIWGYSEEENDILDIEEGEDDFKML